MLHDVRGVEQARKAHDEVATWGPSMLFNIF